MKHIQEDEISLRELIKCVFKKKKIIASSFIIVSLLTSIYAFNPYFEEYEAISSIYITYNYKAPTNPEEIGEGYVYYQDRLQSIMVPTIKGYAQSLSILRSIIIDLDLKDARGNYIKAKDLAKKIKIESKSDSNLIVISSKYNNDKIATKIANKIPEKLIKMAEANSKLVDYEIDIVDYAIANPIVKTNKSIILAIGMILGVVLGIFLAFVVNFFSKKVQLSSQIKSLGLDIDFFSDEICKIQNQYKIISLVKLSDAKRVLIGVEDESAFKISEDVIDSARNYEIGFEVCSFNADDFLIKAKEADMTFMLIEENVTYLSQIEQLALLINKYDINVSVIYISK